MGDLKPIEFRGHSLDLPHAFPLAARREAGYQLDQVQHGQDPDDWKPMSTVGRGKGDPNQVCSRGVSGYLRCQVC